jgi:CubicO group peptidase (beta-lactamase class C family)
VPAKPEQVYRIASISKPITAVAIMQLVEAGKIDLDAPIEQYVPEFPRKSHSFTVRQLLCHQSGVRHYKRDEKPHPEHYDKLIDALALFQDDELLHEPGAKMTYTTYGYTLLGLVVEHASGQSFNDYVREHIFSPARMDRTFMDDSLAIISDRANGYARRPDGKVRNATFEDTSYKIPGGGMLSTPSDLVKFAIAVQSGTLIKPETFEQMCTTSKTSDGKTHNYGLGWSVNGRGPNDKNDRTNIWHGGAQHGANSDLLTRPKQKLAVAIVVNMENARLMPLTDEIADIVTGVAAPTTQLTPSTR